MIALLLLATLQSAATPAGPAVTPAARFERCAALVRSDAAAAVTEATRWAAAGGGVAAHQCGGLALTAQGKFAEAAAEFDAAARAAQLAQADNAAGLYAQAGNAWLAAGDPIKARTALDTALLQGTLAGLQLGEARLDHARALVAAGDMEAARGDIDLALQSAGDDPLAWLLSATLARRMGDPRRAATDIAEALKRSPDDASVQLEAGKIAALAGDEARAKEAWEAAARIAPDSPVGKSARAALTQFGTAPVATPAPTPAKVEGR
jgi:tetratricopeptide (TPR) repeat protein